MEKAKHFYYYSCTTIAYGDGNHGTAIEHRQAAADPRIEDKKLSYRRETARQLPTWRGGGG